MTAAIDPATIAALQHSASAEERVHVLELSDVDGNTDSIPVATNTSPDGRTRVEVLSEVLALVDRRAPNPRSRSGVVEIADLDSFTSYLARYKTNELVAFAEPKPPSITAIFDFHRASHLFDEGKPHFNEGTPGWLADRAIYACPTSRQWRTWTEAANKPWSQAAFGDLIEQNADDLHAWGDGQASAAKMLEVARNLTISTVGKFARTIDPSTGTGTLTVVDEHDKATSTKIPKAFGLRIPVFEGEEHGWQIEARIRFAMLEGRPVFSFLLHNAERIFDEAFHVVQAEVAKVCPVFAGRAPAPITVR